MDAESASEMLAVPRAPRASTAELQRRTSRGLLRHEHSRIVDSKSPWRRLRQSGDEADGSSVATAACNWLDNGERLAQTIVGVLASARAAGDREGRQAFGHRYSKITDVASCRALADACWCAATELLQPRRAQYVHFGATAQDIQDFAQSWKCAMCWMKWSGRWTSSWTGSRCWRKAGPAMR
nr:hypothetical protein [Pseudomonas aeruginosa]